MSKEQDREDRIDAEKRRFIRSLSERGSTGGSGTDSTGGSFGGSDKPMAGGGKGYDVQPENEKVRPKKKKTMIPLPGDSSGDPFRGRLFPEQTLKALEKAKVIDDISKELGLNWENLDSTWREKIHKGVKRTYTADLRE